MLLPPSATWDGKDEGFEIKTDTREVKVSKSMV